MFIQIIQGRCTKQDEMRAMMKAHLDRTLEEAVARLQGRYEDDITAYE